MTSFQSQQRTTLPNGLVVERLPLGHAAGRWWASFVYTQGEGARISPDAWRHVSASAWVHDPDGLLDCVAGGGGGDDDEMEHTWEMVDHGASRARVVYVVDREEVGSELLTLEATDRRGCFSLRLPDGSLIERLPIGHAQGRWRVMWVRSDVPRAEVEADDTDAAIVVGERFIRLRSPAGPLGRLGAGGSTGGAIQPFYVALPDTLTDLEADYLFENEVVVTETLPLPNLSI